MKLAAALLMQLEMLPCQVPVSPAMMRAQVSRWHSRAGPTWQAVTTSDPVVCSRRAHLVGAVRVPGHAQDAQLAAALEVLPHFLVAGPRVQALDKRLVAGGLR